MFDGSDACVTPILGIREAPNFAHNASRWILCVCDVCQPKSRGSFLADGMPRPAPLLSRTPANAANSSNSLEFGANTREVLLEQGFDQHFVDSLIARGVVEQAQ